MSLLPKAAHGAAIQANHGLAVQAPAKAVAAAAIQEANQLRVTGYKLEDILAGLVVPPRPTQNEDEEADPADLRYMSAWLKIRKRACAWLCKQARDGHLIKKHKLATGGDSEFWDEKVKQHDQIVQKGELVTAFESMDPISFYMEVWDSYPEVTIDELLNLLYLMTGAGPKSCLGSTPQPKRLGGQPRAFLLVMRTIHLPQIKYRMFL